MIQMAVRQFRLLHVFWESRRLQSVSNKRVRAVTVSVISVPLMHGQKYNRQCYEKGVGFILQHEVRGVTHR